MIWNRDEECLPREQLESLQLQRLRSTLQRVLGADIPQRTKLLQAGLRTADDLESISDLSRLPFTTKAELREHYPFGMFAVPLGEVVRIQGSSGTRGKPTIVGYTVHDLEVWSEVMARCMTLGGVEPGMVVHNAYGYGLFTGGLGFHHGAECIGCTVIPMSAGLTQRQIMVLQDLGSQVLCCTPSYALNIGQTMRDAGVDPASLRLELGFFGAEPWTEEMRSEIERLLRLTAINVYGLSEIVGPGVAAECREVRQGAHVQEDHFLVEIVDPQSGQPLPPGESGELVFTTLTKEALPLIRYRTGDISSLDLEPCSCGRTTARMARVRGRYDDMLIIRGVNLYPSEIERILLATGEVGPDYQIVVERPAAMDELTVICEPARPDEQDLAALSPRLVGALLQETGLSISVQMVPPGTVPRSEGKAVRVIDRRSSSP